MGYTDRDRERWVAEAPKRANRTAFERDRARIVHSAALRRLASKTQVVGPDTDDFVRNRLTHSLEVAQVGRELGKSLGCDPDVVDAACLAHDLGHPPFGHNGEQALDKAAEMCGGFEGNAQTLRLLTRLESKTFDPVTGRSVGLNLTRASLDAATKYPWRHGDNPQVPGKYGVYDDDLDVFHWLRADAPPASASPALGSAALGSAALGSAASGSAASGITTSGGTSDSHDVDLAPAPRRCLEAQVMDFADDVAYSVHDVEDAIVGGRADPHRLGNPDDRAQIADISRAWYLPDAETDELLDALDRLRGLEFWVGDYDGSRRTLAALKDMTSQLIGRFCTTAEQATHARHGRGRLTRYAADLVVPAETRAEVAVLKGIAAHYVMTAVDRQPLYARQRHLVAGLVDELCKAAPESLEPVFQRDWHAAADDPGRLRVVIDQVASLTDASAVAMHWALTHGQHPARSSPRDHWATKVESRSF